MEYVRIDGKFDRYIRGSQVVKISISYSKVNRKVKKVREGERHQDKDSITSKID